MCIRDRYIIFAWIIAALAVLGGIMTIVETSLDSLRTMYVLVAVLGLSLIHI